MSELFVWNALKSERVKRVRGLSFEEIVQETMIKIRQHPSRENQNVILFERRGYVWVVPYLSVNEKMFLVTLYPSRKFTKLYKRGVL